MSQGAWGPDLHTGALQPQHADTLLSWQVCAEPLQTTGRNMLLLGWPLLREAGALLGETQQEL